MGKSAFITIFVITVLAHVLALRSYITKTDYISRPNVQVRHITMTRVCVKKPKPPKLDIPKIIPPQIQKPVIKTKPKPKKKPRKRVKRKKHPKKIKIPPKPVVHEVITPTPVLPKVETKAPVQMVDTTSIKDRYTSEIRREIKHNLFYPKIAKRMRMQDIVQVAFRVQKDGSITDIRILNHPRRQLANGAIKTLHRLDLKPIPKALNQPHLDITIPIEFKLTQG